VAALLAAILSSAAAAQHLDRDSVSGPPVHSYELPYPIVADYDLSPQAGSAMMLSVARISSLQPMFASVRIPTHGGSACARSISFKGVILSSTPTLRRGGSGIR